MNNMDIIGITGIIGVVIACVVMMVVMVVMLVMYKMGYSDGIHNERMYLIDIMQDIPTVVVKQESVLYVVNYIIKKMREE